MANKKTEIKIQTKRRSTLNTTDILGTIIHEYFKTIFLTNIDVKNTHVVFRDELN